MIAHAELITRNDGFQLDPIENIYFLAVEDGTLMPASGAGEILNYTVAFRKLEEARLENLRNSDLVIVRILSNFSTSVPMYKHMLTTAKQCRALPSWLFSTAFCFEIAAFGPFYWSDLHVMASTSVQKEAVSHHIASLTLPHAGS